MVILCLFFYFFSRFFFYFFENKNGVWIAIALEIINFNMNGFIHACRMTKHTVDRLRRSIDRPLPFNMYYFIITPCRTIYARVERTHTPFDQNRRRSDVIWISIVHQYKVHRWLRKATCVDHIATDATLRRRYIKWCCRRSIRCLLRYRASAFII